MNGVEGYKVASNKSGYEDNFIFLPAAGYRRFDDLGDVGSVGDYWSSSLGESDPRSAWYVVFCLGYFGRNSSGRYYGRSVRPVWQ